MAQRQTQAAPRRPTNVTLPERMVSEAQSLDVNVSQACEQGLALAVRHARDQRWLEENRSALDAWDEYFELNGLPLAQYRQF